jgi:hypothetical protein
MKIQFAYLTILATAGGVKAAITRYLAMVIARGSWDAFRPTLPACQAQNSSIYRKQVVTFAALPLSWGSHRICADDVFRLCTYQS